MTVKSRIASVVAIPVLGLAVLAGIGWFVVDRSSREIDGAVNGTFMPIVSEDVPQLRDMSNAISLLLNADRDAYQAFVAQEQAVSCRDAGTLEALDADNAENAQQVADRMAQASECFDEAMQAEYKRFVPLYAKWRSAGAGVIEQSIELKSSSDRRAAIAAKALDAFGRMRDCLDRIEGLQEDAIAELDKAGLWEKAADLRDSYGLLVNADRDAYQVLEAQMAASVCTDKAQLGALDDDNLTNLDQVAERAALAAEHFDDEMNKVYAEFKTFYAQWRNDSREVISISRANIEKIDARNALAVACAEAFGPMRDGIDTLGGMLEGAIGQLGSAMTERSAAASAAADEMQRQLRWARTAMIVSGSLLSLFAIVLAVIVTRSIIATLGRITASLRDNSDQVSSAAGQVSDSSQQLADGTTLAASSLERTSGHLEQMTGITRMAAESAAQAEKLSGQASDFANKGNEAMVRMSAAIEEIKTSADETAKIVKTIDEIAFQTNLLALNAAVEAARAGEAGKGFAVVAEEVRSLAQRAGQAARDTGTLIEQSVNRAEHGVAINAEVGGALEQIVEVAAKVNDLVGEMSASSSEQSSGIDQVRQAVLELESVVQANAASSEQGAAAGEQLSAQASELNEMVHRLTELIGGIGERPGPSRPVSKARPEVRPAEAALSRTDRAYHDIASEAGSDADELIKF